MSEKTSRTIYTVLVVGLICWSVAGSMADSPPLRSEASQRGPRLLDINEVMSHPERHLNTITIRGRVIRKASGSGSFLLADIRADQFVENNIIKVFFTGNKPMSGQTIEVTGNLRIPTETISEFNANAEPQIYFVSEKWESIK